MLTEAQSLQTGLAGRSQSPSLARERARVKLRRGPAGEGERRGLTLGPVLVDGMKAVKAEEFEEVVERCGRERRGA